jgi:excisionase family DNA binding protein
MRSFMQETRIISDVYADAKRAVFSALDGLTPREQARRASAIVRALRAAGLLARGIDCHYSAKEAAAVLGRSDEYVMKLIRDGKLQPVSRDDRGWLIPASTLQQWLDDHAFHAFSKSSRISSLKTGANGENISTKGAAEKPGMSGESNPIDAQAGGQAAERLQTQGSGNTDAGDDAAHPPVTPALEREPSLQQTRGGGGSDPKTNSPKSHGCVRTGNLGKGAQRMSAKNGGEQNGGAR